MKTIRQFAPLALTCIMAFVLVAAIISAVVSCGGLNKKEADTTGNEQTGTDTRVETVTGTTSADTGMADATNASSQQQPDAPQQSSAAQEKIDWLSGDFKIELDEVPQGVLLSVFGTKAAEATPARKVAIKSGGRLYYSTTENGRLDEFVFVREGDKVISHLIIPAARSGVRSESNWSSVEAVLRSELQGSVWSEPKSTAKLTKTGSERIAGIDCEVYEMTIGLDDESAAVANAFAALGSMLGGGKNGKEASNNSGKNGGQAGQSGQSGQTAFENPLDGMGGKATMWIDPTRRRFVARRHVRMTMNGSTTDRVTHNVIFFSPGNAHAHEIPDLSTYTFK